MSDHRGQPAYALKPPTASEGAVSGAKLVTQRPGIAPLPPPPPSQSGPIAVAASAPSAEPKGNAQWGELGTAPTLLLTPREDADEGESGVSTTRIATPPAMAADPAWFRSGNTVPPPSMRPPADSAPTVAEKRPPNPRVVKIVGGVIGACLFIVAVASVKLLYQRAASAGTRDEAAASSARVEATASAPALANPAPEVPHAVAAAPSAPPPPAAPAAAAPAHAAHAAPAHAPTPARVTPKAAPRRAPPVTKKKH